MNFTNDSETEFNQRIIIKTCISYFKYSNTAI